ncbi:class I SAM-dependent methyltransferase (plasmid) [Cereibacter sphaeroides]|nr:class I SAM-dependent methyltransferase [Cereibacter sphaeroides]
MTAAVYAHQGFCNACGSPAEFRSQSSWFRDNLFCSVCGSIPRERALATVLERARPDWRDRRIHESSPADRGISARLARECRSYVASQFFPGEPLGATVRGFRNENLEAQTFEGGRFDLVVTLDVMEHVNEPEKVFREVFRTLVPGGAYLFSVPTYKERVTSERRARYRPDGGIDHLAEPEYHGNPVSDAGSLVTFHYGYDLPELIHAWAGFDVELFRFHHHHLGLIGEFTEIYLATRPA